MKWVRFSRSFCGSCLSLFRDHAVGSAIANNRRLKFKIKAIYDSVGLVPDAVALSGPEWCMGIST